MVIEKNSPEFWIFSIDDPELRHFYTARANDTSFYYILYIEECLEDFYPEQRKVLHLQNKCLLLIDNYLVPIYSQLPLKGHLIVVTEAICELDIHKALLKLFFFPKTPEGIRNLGAISEAQEACINFIYEEYQKKPDDFQYPIMRNLMISLFVLSPAVNYDKPMKAGHLLNYALQFMDLANEYAFREKKKSFYAEKLSITEKTLSQALQVIFNRTFREILICKTLIEAMRMLVFTDKSVNQIAHELYYDPSGFNKLFLKWKGMYPNDLRVNYRKLVEHVKYNY